MDLCSDGHPEICYDGNFCPMCDLETDLRSEIKDSETKAAKLQEEVGDLEDKIYTLTHTED